MSILDMIGGQNSGAVQQLAAQFGLRPEQAQAAMSVLLPLVTAGVQREAQAKGTDGLAAALAKGQHEKYLSEPAALADPATVTDGNAILGHIFGSKDVSRQVATNAAQKTGIDPALLKKMLPVVAAIAMGAIARRSKSAGPAAGAGAGASAGGLGGILGSLLDRDRDGSVIDDLGGMIGSSMGRKA
jgi:hypothetical protein